LIKQFAVNAALQWLAFVLHIPYVGSRVQILTGARSTVTEAISDFCKSHYNNSEQFRNLLKRIKTQ